MLSGTTAVVYWTDPTLPKGQVIYSLCVFIDPYVPSVLNLNSDLPFGSFNG